jgi:hypothetical protein
MFEDSWAGQGLPAGYDFDNLRETWEIMGSDMLERLQYFSEPSFQFPEMAKGQKDILRIVGHAIFVANILI